MPKAAFSVLYTTQVKRHPRNRVWNDGFLVLDTTNNRTAKLVTEAGNALTEWCQLPKSWLPVTSGTEGLDCFDGFLVNCDAECRPSDVPGEGGWEESPAPEPRAPEPAAPTLPQRHPRRPARSRALHLQPRKRPAPEPEPEPERPRREQPPGLSHPHGRAAVLRAADVSPRVESPATSADENDEEMARELSCVARWFGAAAGEPLQPAGAQHAQHASAQRASAQHTQHASAQHASAQHAQHATAEQVGSWHAAGPTAQHGSWRAADPTAQRSSWHAAESTAQHSTWRAADPTAQHGAWQAVDAPLPEEVAPRQKEPVPEPGGTGCRSGAAQPGHRFVDSSNAGVQQGEPHMQANVGVSHQQQQQQGSGCLGLPDGVRPEAGGLAEAHAVGPGLRTSSRVEWDADPPGAQSAQPEHEGVSREEGGQGGGGSRDEGGQGGLRTKWGVADAGWGAPPTAKAVPAQTVTAVDDAFDLGI